MWKIVWIVLFAWNAWSTASSVDDGHYGWAVLSAFAALFALFMLVREDMNS